MPIELLLFGLALVIAVLAVLPAGRRVMATFVDIVDGSVAMFAVRRALGLDTTTARQRRIDRRHAREQAEILRRIGGPGYVDAGPPAPVPSAPNRLVVSGDASATEAGDAPTSMPRGADRRRSMLRDGLVATVGLAMVVLAVSTLVNQPSGAVLGATSPPRERVGASAPSMEPVPTEAPATTSTAASPATEPIEAPAASAAPSTAGPQVGALQARLAGRIGGGRTVTMRLAWTLRPGSEPATGFRISLQVGDRAFERVASVDGTTRSLGVTVGVGRTSTFRIEPLGAGGREGVATDWAPITPAIQQETSRPVDFRGPWRDAAGPSLSGGTVTFSGTRGATLSFTFHGTDIGWIATRTPLSGRAQVRIDGRLVDTIDLAAPDVRYRQLLFHRHVGDDGRHTLQIRALGDGRVDVDAFIVLR
jgi:hypothetical protein